LPVNQFFTPTFLAGLLLFNAVSNIIAQNSSTNSSWKPEASAPLQHLLDGAAQSTLAQFAAIKLEPEQLAATLIDLRDPQHPVQASYRGEAQIYPASVIKLFYLVAAHRWLEDKKIADTAELRRAMRDMIVDSYNEATGYVIDVLTGTTSGPELPPQEIEQWWDKRNAVNRYFSALGYTNINVNKKPWCEGPYGRETQAIALFQPTRNQLTTDATARLMTEIVTGRAVSAERCRQMMELLQRNPGDPSADSDNQARGFTGLGIPEGTKLWSKAGWTSETRHDCAYLELPNGQRVVLVIFTVGHAKEREIIPALAREIIAGLPHS
jgi:beta-lactamase class A